MTARLEKAGRSCHMTYEAAKASAIAPRKRLRSVRQEAALGQVAGASSGLFFLRRRCRAGVWMILAPKSSLEQGALENRLW